MERHRFGNSDLDVSAIGLGCYGMSGVYGPADDTESIASIRRALDLGVNFLDTSASYGSGHNHRLIGEAIKGRRHEVVIHSKSGSPRDGSGGGGDARYLRETCETSLRNLGIETLDVFCMSRIDPDVPVEESVAAMAALVKEGKTRFIALSECSAESLRRGSAVHPLVSLQMEYSLFSRDAEAQGQIAACKTLGLAMMAYAVLGRGLISAVPPRPESLGNNDARARVRQHVGQIVANGLDVHGDPDRTDTCDRKHHGERRLTVAQHERDTVPRMHPVVAKPAGQHRRPLVEDTEGQRALSDAAECALRRSCCKALEQRRKPVVCRRQPRC